MTDLITKNKKIFVDIVIPVLNEERTIEQCIKSVLCFQKDDNVKVQIFIVDGGSSDKTLDIIKANSNSMAPPRYRVKMAFSFTKRTKIERNGCDSLFPDR